MRSLRNTSGRARLALRSKLGFRNRYRIIAPEMMKDLKSSAFRYSERLRSKSMPAGRYRYKDTINDPPVLYASVFAALLLHLTGQLERLTEDELKEWANYINDHQHNDGLFRDPLVENEIAAHEDWWGWRHLSLLALMALSALGQRPRYPFHFLEVIDTRSKVQSWLSQLDWGPRASFTSNTVQNYGAALQYARDFLGESSLQDPLEELFAGLEERCNPVTGLWGSGIADPQVALSEGVQAGYHFWLLYWYDGREIPSAEVAFNSLISLQNRLGGFVLDRKYSSACEDIDALDPLVRLALRNSRLRIMTLPAIRNGLRWVLSNFNDDGGAIFRRGESFLYGHQLMYSGVNESSIFATWFRMLSVANCCELLMGQNTDLEQVRFQYLKCPGLQFSPVHMMSAEERQ